MKKPARHIIDITWEHHRWVSRPRVRGTKSYVLYTDRATQKAAISLCAQFFRARLRKGLLGQLVVHGKTGRILFERTYGKDPVRTKG